MVGLRHSDLAADVRESLSDAFARLESAGSFALMKEHVLLRTCARTELYLVTDEPAAAFRDVCAALASLASDALPIESNVRFATSRAAIRHLFRTTAGLDSAVLGEAEVQGQVRQALAEARRGHGVGAILGRLFEHALAAGRAVRRETEIGRGHTSLASAAVDWAERRLRRRSVSGSALIVGAGVTARSLALRLAKGPWHTIAIANRTPGRAQRLASEVGGAGYGLEGIVDRMGEADACFFAVEVPEPLVDAAAFATLQARRDSPLLLADLSHPRAVVYDEPTGSEIDLSTLQAEVQAAEGRRARWIPEAEERIDAAVDEYVRWVRGRTAVPVLVELRNEVMDQALAEADRAGRGRTPAEREAFRRLARSIARTVLHGPTSALREADIDTPSGADVAAVVREVFDLPGARSNDETDGRVQV